MTLLKLYLAAYFALLVAAAVALWQSGVLHQVPPIWVALAVVIAIAIGVLLAISSGVHFASNTHYRRE